MDPNKLVSGLEAALVREHLPSPQKKKPKEKKKKKVLMLQMIISLRQVQRTQKQDTCFSQKRAVVEQSDARYEDAVAHRDEALQRQAWGGWDTYRCD
eukprot:COSAG06_NODE_1151_length_10496_cov_14.282004_12_plen_97_part_00